jgi:hypothetical protein
MFFKKTGLRSDPAVVRDEIAAQLAGIRDRAGNSLCHTPPFSTEQIKIAVS